MDIVTRSSNLVYLCLKSSQALAATNACKAKIIVPPRRADLGSTLVVDRTPQSNLARSKLIISMGT
jgi:hypothetical protein